MLTQLFGPLGNIPQGGGNRLTIAFTGVGKKNATALAIEQLHTQVLFERTNLAADGGLGKVQLVRRTGETL